MHDTLFSAALHEMSHVALNYDYNRLETLVFNPIEQITSKFNHPLASSLDPDFNFFEYSLPKSNYMVEDEVNNLDSMKQYDSSFSLLHLNSRSLLGNFDKFQSLIANLNYILTSDTVNIPGYYFISNHRKHKTGGGVGTHLRNVFQYNLIQDCTIFNPEVIESLFVEICNPLGKNTIVGTVYRPPNQNINPFLDELNRILSTISKDNKNCYLMGDFNLDLLRYDEHAVTQELIDSLFSYMFIPIITINCTHWPLMNNIFTNCLTHNMFKKSLRLVSIEYT
jgi:hypothetical protein